MKWQRKNWLALLGLAAATATTAAPLPKSGTFVFSNACASPGGDFSGYRLRLTRNSKGVQAIVEFNDDGPDGRGAARGLTFSPQTGALRFSFRGSDGDQYSFRGMASAEKLAGALNVKLKGEKNFSQGQPMTLPMVKGAQKELPPCDPHFPP